jgi:hypothetical protein
MNKLRIFFTVSGALMVAYFLFAFFTFIWSAGAYIFDGTSFSEDGHAMFLNIFSLPAKVLFPLALNCIYAIFQINRFFKNKRNIVMLSNLFENIFSN